MLFSISKDLSKKLQKTHPSRIKPLDLNFSLEALSGVHRGDRRLHWGEARASSRRSRERPWRFGNPCTRHLDQLVGHSDFGPQMVMESFKETIEQALIDIRETAPRIYGRDQKHYLLPKAISLTSVSKGVSPAWQTVYSEASPPVQGEIFCIS